jgi:type II secretion system protein G
METSDVKAMPPRTCGLAVASPVLAILGLYSFGIAGLAGMIVGIFALSKIDGSRGKLGGRNVAVSGIAASIFLAIFGLVAGLVVTGWYLDESTSSESFPWVLGITTAVGLMAVIGTSGAVIRSQDRRGREDVAAIGIAASLVFAVVCFVAGLTVLAPGCSSRNALTKVQIKRLKHELDHYNRDIGHYPTDGEGGLRAMLVKPAFGNSIMDKNWQGPYINYDQLTDPWGTPLHYHAIPSGTPAAGEARFKLWSCGPDLTPGTDDDIMNLDADPD